MRLNNRPELEEGWTYHHRVAVPGLVADAIAADAARAEAEVAYEKEARALLERLAPKPDPVKNIEWGFDSPAGSGPHTKVFDRSEAERFEAVMPPGDSDQKKRKEEIVKLLRRRGEYRRLAALPDDWRERLNAFAARFPNVTEAIEYLRHAFALAEQGDRVPRLTPILLGGEPGVGKSHFARSFAEFLGSSFAVMSMETLQSGSALSGSQEFWGNTKPGLVFEQLCERDHANPVILLEELDKTAGDYGYGDPRNALYQLFEPATAREFRDLSVPAIALDASRVIWIATANDPSLIPAPLLSRMHRIEVKVPTLEQSRTIAVGIFARLREEFHLPNTFAEPSAEVMGCIASLSPRRIRQVLQAALGQALYDRRSRLQVEDIRLPPEAAGGSRRVGFV